MEAETLIAVELVPGGSRRVRDAGQLGERWGGLPIYLCEFKYAHCLWDLGNMT